MLLYISCFLAVLWNMIFLFLNRKTISCNIFFLTFKKFLFSYLKHFRNFPISCFWFNYTHLWPFSESKFSLMSGRVNLVAPTSPIECLLNLPNVRAIQYKLGPERLTQLGNSNVLRLSVCKRNHKWSSVQRWQCPIQYGTIKSSVYNFKNDYFLLWFLYKSDYRNPSRNYEN